MKIILTCGHPYSGHYSVGDILHKCGVSKAQPSNLVSYTPEILQTKIFEVCEWSEDNSKASLPTLGKMWQELASSLLIANLSQPMWGWVDSQTVWLLEFWKDFDPQIRFILVYSHPEFVICNMLQQQVDAPENMANVLAGWNRYNTELLRFYNNNQDRCLLVNAQTALQHPETFINKVSEAFAINLRLSKDDINTFSISCVAAGLACSLISSTSSTEQNPLYLELESKGDIISYGAKPGNQGRLQAWSEYNSLVNQLKSSVRLSEQQQLELTTLRNQQIALKQQTQSNYDKQQELEQQNQLLLLQLQQIQEELTQHFLDKQKFGEKEKQLIINVQERQQEIDNLKSNMSKLEIGLIAKQDLEQENELLLLQLHQIQEELTQHFLDKQEFDEKEKQLIINVQERQQEIDNLKSNMSKLEAGLTAKQNLEQENELLLLQLYQTQEELTQHFLNKQEFDEKEKQLIINIQEKQQEIDNLKNNVSKLEIGLIAKQDLEQENELLLLQLHQIQEELEHYFLEYQKISNTSPELNYDLVGISLDLCKETFIGDNWYYAEFDGRWAGPNSSSTINIPPLAQNKDYEIVLDVIGSMANEIIDEIQASINGKSLKIQHPKPPSLWKRRFKKEIYSYPRKLRMYFSAKDIDNVQPWVLKLDFPKVISPSECGLDSQDKRKLAIRLHNITCIQL